MPPEQWLEQNLKAGAKLGYDPWLHTAESAEKLQQAPAPRPAPSWWRSTDNPIDALWRDRPAPPAAPVAPARPQARRRKRRRQAQAHPGRARQAARRRPGGVGRAERGLGLQHPRRRRAAHTARARLRAHPARGPAGALCGRRQAGQRGPPRAGTICRRAPARELAATWRSLAARPSGSTRRPPPRR